MSRVTEIRYIGYGVADLEIEATFYATKWGLEEVAQHTDRVWFRAAGHDEPYVLRLRRSNVNHLDVIAMAADTRGDVDTLHEVAVAARCRILHPPRQLDGPGAGYGFRFFSPDGLPLEVSAEVTRGPSRAIGRWEGIPVRISHVVLHSPKPSEAARFFTEVLGFKISDWLGDFMCFLRCNDAHHRVAILPGPPCLNHVAYDMLDVDAMMRGISRLRECGVEIRWGPGRHTAGDNTFSYFVTPAGFAVEYTAELQKVDFNRHVARIYAPGPRVMDQWGIGVGGPQSMPHPVPDPRLFQAATD